MFNKAIGLFYDRERNVFVDEGGFIIWRLFELITPNDLYLFRLRQEHMVVNCKSIPGAVVELYWPEEDDEAEFDDWEDAWANAREDPDGSCYFERR